MIVDQDERCLTRKLYRLSLLVAAGLAAAVLFSPLLPLHGGIALPWDRFCSLFAHDVALRKIAVVSALGLWVTAVTFFRTPSQPS